MLRNSLAIRSLKLKQCSLRKITNLDTTKELINMAKLIIKKTNGNRWHFFSLVVVILVLISIAYQTPALKKITIAPVSQILLKESKIPAIAQFQSQFSALKIIPLTIKRKTAKKENEISLIFVGDIMLSRKVGDRIAAAKDVNFPFQYVKDFLSGADVTFANLENPISNQGADEGHLYSFRARPETKIGLAAAGIDVVSLANNHSFDWGSQALLDTINQLNSVGIAAVGAGADIAKAYQPIIFDLGGTKIAYFAFTDIEPKSAAASKFKPGVAWVETEKILDSIKKARVLADFIVVSLHTGIEYQGQHSKNQEQIADQLLSSGVDLIIGHHPHVRQDYQIQGRQFVFYSLGNFIFDQSWSDETSLGYAVEAVIEKKEIARVSVIEVQIDKSSFQPKINSASRKVLLKK